MEFVPLLVVAALVLALINLYKIAVAGEWAKVGLQLVSWLVGIGVAFLLRASDYGATFLVGTGEDAIPIADLNPFSVVLVGVALAAVANVAYDALPISTPTPFEQTTEPEYPTNDLGEPDPNADDPDAPREAGELPDWVADPSKE